MSEIDAFAAGRDGDLAALLREVGDLTTGLTGTLEELGTERLDGTDAGGAVRARVCGNGRLLGLDIDAKGLRDLDHAQLAAAVLEAVGTAHAAMGDRLAELTGHASGNAHVDGADPLASHIQRILREG